MKYKDEEASIQDIFNIGGKIIEMVTLILKDHPKVEYREYFSLGCVWRAYGLILQLINKSKELSLSQKCDILENAKKWHIKL